MNKRIFLERFAYSPHGTFGTLRVGDRSWYTVELPWEGNAQQTSCIPEGVYTLKKRFSPVVQRSSGNEFSSGWEVTDVINRSYIMLHPGNTIDDLQGCIAPGKGLGFLKNKWAVTASRQAFREMMAAMEAEETWDLVIKQVEAAYP